MTINAFHVPVPPGAVEPFVISKSDGLHHIL
jgi:hypothetical protein